MDRSELLKKKFNSKRPGALIGTITEVSEYLRLLYELVGKSGDNHNGSCRFQEHSEKSTYGACNACNGTGTVNGDIDPNRMIAPELSLKHGAVLLWAGTSCGPVSMLKELAKMIGIDFERPLAEQDKRFIDILLNGYDEEPVSYVHKNKNLISHYHGCVFQLRHMRDAGTTSKGNLRAVDFFSRKIRCPECNGSELNAESLALSIEGQSIVEVSSLPISGLLLFIHNLTTTHDEHELMIASEVIDEIEKRLIYLNKIGLKALPSIDLQPRFSPKIG
ncbi:hypothetical protein AB6A23_05165 [Paenibacillus tarimensis]